MGRTSISEPIHWPWLAPMSITNDGDCLNAGGRIRMRDRSNAKRFRGEQASNHDGEAETPESAFLASMICATKLGAIVLTMLFRLAIQGPPGVRRKSRTDTHLQFDALPRTFDSDARKRFRFLGE